MRSIHPLSVLVFLFFTPAFVNGSEDDASPFRITVPLTKEGSLPRGSGVAFGSEFEFEHGPIKETEPFRVSVTPATLSDAEFPVIAFGINSTLCMHLNVGVRALPDIQTRNDGTAWSFNAACSATPIEWRTEK